MLLLLPVACPYFRLLIQRYKYFLNFQKILKVYLYRGGRKDSGEGWKMRFRGEELKVWWPTEGVRGDGWIRGSLKEGGFYGEGGGSGEYGWVRVSLVKGWFSI